MFLAWNGIRAERKPDKERAIMTKRTWTTVFAFLLVGTLGLVAACKPKPPKSTAEAKPPTEEPSRPPAETRVPPPPGNVPPGGVDSSGLPTDVADINAKGYLKDAFFEYAKADLRDDVRTALAADAEWLKRYRSVQFLIEGHCDERGTSEYNLALGDRRANAAKEYLVSLGVDASRVKTVSYGRERPFCSESTEDCWQQNRRGHFLVTAK
jgi:peptidoglycan-associated lipoprotein